MARRLLDARALIVAFALIALPALACDFSFSVGNVSATPTRAATAIIELPTATVRVQVVTATPLAKSSSSSIISKSSGTGIISDVVLAREVTPLTNSPLSISDTFPPDGEIHVNLSLANAPAGTNIRAVWSVINATGIPSNSEITSYRATVQGSRYLDIVFYGTSRLPVGTYKIDVFLNEQLDRTLTFSVKENIAAFRTPTPQTIGKCPPPSAPVYKPPLIARALTMAESVKSDTVEPVNPTRQFKPTSVFHAIIDLDNAPANSKIKAVWYALDTGGLEPCNTRLGENEITITSSKRVWFNFRPPDKWVAGIYKVEIYVNDNLNNGVDFRVQ
jgi:hypothetical protein